jgi:hypothetical protein
MDSTSGLDPCQVWGCERAMGLQGIEMTGTPQSKSITFRQRLHSDLLHKLKLKGSKYLKQN